MNIVYGNLNVHIHYGSTGLVLISMSELSTNNPRYGGLFTPAGLDDGINEFQRMIDLYLGYISVLEADIYKANLNPSSLGLSDPSDLAAYVSIKQASIDEYNSLIAKSAYTKQACFYARHDFQSLLDQFNASVNANQDAPPPATASPIPAGPVKESLAALNALPGSVPGADGPASAFASLTENPAHADYVSTTTGVSSLIELLPATAFPIDPVTGERTIPSLDPSSLTTTLSAYSAEMPNMIKKQLPLAVAAASNYENLMNINTAVGGSPPAVGTSPGCDFINNVFKAVKEVGTLLSDTVSGIVGAFSGMISSLQPVISKVGTVLGKVFSGVGDFLKELGTLIGPVKDIIKDIIGSLGNVLSDIASGIGSVVSAVAQGIADSVTTFGKWVADGAAALASGLDDLINTSFLSNIGFSNPCADDVKNTVYKSDAINPMLNAVAQGKVTTSAKIVPTQTAKWLNSSDNSILDEPTNTPISTISPTPPPSHLDEKYSNQTINNWSRALNAEKAQLDQDSKPHNDAVQQIIDWEIANDYRGIRSKVGYETGGNPDGTSTDPVLLAQWRPLLATRKEMGEHAKSLLDPYKDRKDIYNQKVAEWNDRVVWGRYYVSALLDAGWTLTPEQITTHLDSTTVRP